MDFTTLGSLIEKHGGVIQTGPFGSQLHQHEYVENGIPVIMPKDIQNGRVDESTVARISEQKAQELSRHILKAGSIVFPRRGEINKCAYISEAQAGFLCGTGCLKIEVPSEILSPKFLFYYLGLRHVVEWLEKNAVGTTMLNLNTSIVGGLSVPLIDKNQQERIVDILSAYDDLIENNRRRIDLLEQSARMLYKEWFVSLRFPGHEHVKVKDGVPQGWEVKRIGDCFHLPGGFSFKSGTYQNSGKYGIVTIKNVQDSKFEPKCSGYIDDVPDGLPQHCYLTTGDLLMSLTGNVGRVCIVYGENYLLNQRVAKIIPQSGISKNYAYWTFTNESLRRIIENLAYGVAQLNLSASKVQSLDWILPTHQLLDLFDNYTSGIFEEIYTLNLANEKLKEARDLLLPRLMNGEIPV